MNGQQNNKAPVKYHWGRLLAAALAVLAFFVIRGCLTPANIEYKTLDYDAVMRTPNIFADEYVQIEGTILQIIPTTDDVDTKDIYLQVRENGNPDHIWIVYGPISVEDAQKIQPNMDFSAKGSFVGTMTVNNMVGGEITRPAVYSLDFEFGYKLGGENHD